MYVQGDLKKVKKVWEATKKWQKLNIEYYLPQTNCPNRIANIIRAVKYI